MQAFGAFLIGLALVVIVGIYVYNVVTEGRARKARIKAAERARSMANHPAGKGRVAA